MAIKYYIQTSDSVDFVRINFVWLNILWNFQSEISPFKNNRRSFGLPEFSEIEKNLAKPPLANIQKLK